jgi:hypothetical protein
MNSEEASGETEKRTGLGPALWVYQSEKQVEFDVLQPIRKYPKSGIKP